MVPPVPDRKSDNGTQRIWSIFKIINDLRGVRICSTAKSKLTKTNTLLRRNFRLHSLLTMGVMIVQIRNSIWRISSAEFSTEQTGSETTSTQYNIRLICRIKHSETNPSTLPYEAISEFKTCPWMHHEVPLSASNSSTDTQQRGEASINLWRYMTKTCHPYNSPMVEAQDSRKHGKRNAIWPSQQYQAGMTLNFSNTSSGVWICGVTSCVWVHGRISDTPSPLLCFHFLIPPVHKAHIPPQTRCLSSTGVMEPLWFAPCGSFEDWRLIRPPVHKGTRWICSWASYAFAYHQHWSCFCPQCVLIET